MRDCVKVYKSLLFNSEELYGGGLSSVNHTLHDAFTSFLVSNEEAIAAYIESSIPDFLRAITSHVDSIDLLVDPKVCTPMPLHLLVDVLPVEYPRHACILPCCLDSRL